MKLRNLAPVLTHLLFASFIVLALSKYVHVSESASPDEGTASRTAAIPDVPERKELPAKPPRIRTAAMIGLDSTPDPAPTPAPFETTLDRLAEQAPTEATDSPLVKQQAPAERTGIHAPDPLTVHDTAGRQTAAPAPQPADTGIPPQPARSHSRHTRLLARLVAAYPDFLAGYEGNELIWHDGTRMPFDDGREKTFKERLTSPDIEDQFYVNYPRGRKGLPPPVDADPGRVRYQPLFTKMYGDCRKQKAAVRGKLEEVVWLPKNWGKKIRFTSVNGAADALRRVSADLDRLPRRFLRYMRPIAGTYHCRTIAGTKRLSMHAFGAAIDINAKYGDYWRWSGAKGSGNLKHRNRIPWEIVEIFERHGFVWGGKWYHYDTLHFEYRPELLKTDIIPVAKSKPVPGQSRPTMAIPQCLQRCRISHLSCRSACDSDSCRRNCDLDRNFCEARCRAGGLPRR